MTRLFIVFLCSVVVNTAIARTEESAVSIDFRQRVMFAPGYVKAKVSLPRHEDNRELCAVIAEGELIVFRRCVSVEGAQHARTEWFEFKDIPPGEFEVFATVRRPLETKYSGKMRLEVKGRE